MAESPRLLLSAMLAPAEFLLNQLLKQDTLLASKLARHKGTTLQINCTGPALTVYLVVENTGLRLVQDAGGDITATFTGTLPALAGLLLQSTPSLHRSGVSVAGDMQKAQAIQSLLSASSIDWAWHLSRLLGDVPVQAASDMAEDAAGKIRRNADSIGKDLDEYIHEEARLLPGPDELEIFYSGLDALKLRLDRLRERLTRLN